MKRKAWLALQRELLGVVTVDSDVDTVDSDESTVTPLPKKMPKKMALPKRMSRKAVARDDSQVGEPASSSQGQVDKAVTEDPYQVVETAEREPEVVVPRKGLVVVPPCGVYAAGLLPCGKPSAEDLKRFGGRWQANRSGAASTSSSAASSSRQGNKGKQGEGKSMAMKGKCKKGLRQPEGPWRQKG